MNKQKLLWFLFLFVFVACTNNKTTQQQEINEIDVTEISLVEKYDVLIEIHKMIDSVGLLTLPYKIDFQQSPIFIDDVKVIEYCMVAGGNLVYGVLPDTTNFYGLIIDKGADIYEPYLFTFDKKGNFVDEKRLIEDNCYEMVGEPVFCDEYIQINEDLTLFYYYNTKHFYDLMDDGGSFDCKHYEKKGSINKKGEIIFETRQEFPVDNCDTVNQ